MQIKNTKKMKIANEMMHLLLGMHKQEEVHFLILISRDKTKQVHANLHTEGQRGDDS
jgi:hypothetical protein